MPNQMLRSRHLNSTILLAGVACFFVTSAIAADDSNGNKTERYWPQWRGPLGVGVAPGANPPVQWSEVKNIRWKIALPGRGHATPIIWKNRVFITTAMPVGEALKPKYSGAPGAHDNLPVTHRHKFVALAVNRRDGKILWQ